MSNFNLSVGGQPLQNYQLNQVKDGVSLEEAKQVLEAEKDGYDTLGVHIEGVDYLISGQGLNAKAGDEVMLEGEAVGKVAFVEQEDNTFAEGFKTGMSTKMGGLEKSVAGAPFSLAAGVAKGTAAAAKGTSEDTLKKVTQGPPITREIVEDAVKAFESFFGHEDD